MVYRVNTTLKYVIIGIMIATFLVPHSLLVPNVAFATLNEPRDPFTDEERESGLYNEDGYLLDQSKRPPINPDFNVDEDCKFDSYQIKCQPGSEQRCPWGPGTNEDYSCVPSDIECPEGYNIADDDETGQCIPNEECGGEGKLFEYYILLEREDRSDRCAALYTLCGNEEHKEEGYCIDYCNDHPNGMGCKPEAN